MQQLNMFNFIEKDIKEILKSTKSKLRKYGIDELYRRKFCNGKTHTLKEIRETLTNIKTYKDYLKILHIEISKYIPIRRSRYM